MKKVLVVTSILLALFCGEVIGQQQPTYTQYMFNELAINPAYAGSHETISLTALARRQWSGVDGAPETQTFSIHSPVKNQNMGLGLLVFHDQIGITEQTGSFISYAYRIPLSEKSRLGFGLQGGVTNYQANYSEISVTDPSFAGADVKELIPNVGFGVYFNSDRFYAGFSIPQLLENTVAEGERGQTQLVRHYFMNMGYLFDLSSSLKFKPNVLFKYVDGSPFQMDINANFLIREVIWLGASWRSLDTFDLLFQLQITPGFQLGYSYDFYHTNDLQSVSNGTHELMLNYRFSFDKKKVITPRYF